MSLTMQRGEDEPEGGVDFRRFEALFATELDELHERAADRGVSIEAVAEAYFVIVNGERPMVTHSTLQDELGREGPDVWNIASVLVDFGEVHRSKGSDWWWIVAPSFLAERCDQRSISLKTYIEMRPDLEPFQNAVVRWYQTRQMHGNLQNRTMKELKLEHGEEIQAKYYPDKPLDTGNFHDHQVARYIKTAQDVIVEALDLTY